MNTANLIVDVIQTAGGYVLALVTICANVWTRKIESKNQRKQSKERQEHERSLRAREEERKLSREIAELQVKINARANEYYLRVDRYIDPNIDEEIKKNILKEISEYEHEKVRKDIQLEEALISLLGNEEIYNEFKKYKRKHLTLVAKDINGKNIKDEIMYLSINIDESNDKILSYLGKTHTAP